MWRADNARHGSGVSIMVTAWDAARFLFYGVWERDDPKLVYLVANVLRLPKAADLEVSSPSSRAQISAAWHDAQVAESGVEEDGWDESEADYDLPHGHLGRRFLRALVAGFARWEAGASPDVAEIARSLLNDGMSEVEAIAAATRLRRGA